MDQRKIMSLGRSSLVVSLPKDWVKSNKLGPGDLISMEVQRNHSLALFPGVKGKKELEKGILHVDPDEGEESIVRRLIAYYLNGHSSIEIVSKKIFSTDQLKAIRRIVGILYMRIMESDAKKIHVETLIDESKASVVSGTQRMHMITISMCQDALIAFRNRDTSLADAVISLDDDVDQFSFFLLRLLRSAALDPTLANQLGLMPINCLDYQTLVHRIENVADVATNICRLVISLVEGQQELSERLLAILLKTGIDAIDSYNTAVYAFFSKDVSKSDEIIERQERIETQDLARVRALLLLTEKKNELLICAICSVSDSIKRIAEYAADIAEATLDASLVIEV